MCGLRERIRLITSSRYYLSTQPDGRMHARVSARTGAPGPPEQLTLHQIGVEDGGAITFQAHIGIRASDGRYLQTRYHEQQPRSVWASEDVIGPWEHMILRVID